MFKCCLIAVDVFVCSYDNLRSSIGAQGCCRQLLMWLPLLVCVCVLACLPEWLSGRVIACEVVVGCLEMIINEPATLKAGLVSCDSSM